MFTFSLLVPIAQDKDLELSYCILSVRIIGSSRIVVISQDTTVIMDDMFIHSTAKEHMDDLIDLFKVLRKYGLKLSPHKSQFFKNSKYKETKYVIPH